MTKFVDPHTLKNWLHDDAEIALFDVREQGQYGESHLFYGVPTPYSRLELDAPRLAPRRSVRLVVYDEDETIALPAAHRLAAIGYSDVHVLIGGTRAWQASGYQLFSGVNVPSKTFGELVEQQCHTPSISASALFELQQRGDNVVILDGRPFTEYQKMTIPGSICCPNGELSYRVYEMINNPDATIVVNCAGRTRSIIGAQTLINLGLPNRIMALENGTQGWFLEDFKLEHGSTRRYPDHISKASLLAARMASGRLAQRFDVQEVNASDISEWMSSGACSVFLCDVRTPREYGCGTLNGAQSTPGGQLIQATDQYIGVRHARLVLFDDDGIRAPVVASWLKQLGHDAYVLTDGLHSRFSLPAHHNALVPPDIAPLRAISATELATGLAENQMCVVDVRSSMQYRKSHIPGALWAIRPRLSWLNVPVMPGAIVFVADEDAVAALAARDLRQLLPGELNHAPFRRLEGGVAAWAAAQLPLENTPDQPADADCIDYLFFVHDRHDGNKAAARQYLQWEMGLLAKLDQRERAAFSPAERC